MADFIDTFNRADGALGASWTSGATLGEWGVLSNQAYPLTFGTGLGLSAVATSAVTFTADQEAEVIVTSLSTGDQVGPAVRCNAASGNGYYVKVDGFSDPNRRLFRMVGGTETAIGAVNLAASVGDVFKVRARGNLITVFRNGVLLEQVLDTTFATGQPGLAFFWGNVRGSRVDAFYASDVADVPSGGWGGGAPWATSARPLRTPYRSQHPPRNLLRAQAAEAVFAGAFFGSATSGATPLYQGARGSAVVNLGTRAPASLYLGPRTLF